MAAIAEDSRQVSGRDNSIRSTQNRSFPPVFIAAGPKTLQESWRLKTAPGGPAAFAARRASSREFTRLAGWKPLAQMVVCPGGETPPGQGGKTWPIASALAGRSNRAVLRG